MGEIKVKVAVFDEDLQIRKYGKFPLSKDGTKIKIVSGGEGHWMPQFDRNSYLEFPQRSLVPPFPMRFERVYFVKNHAPKCVDFSTEKVHGLDPEVVKKYARMEILTGIGQDKQETPFITYLILLLAALSVLLQMGIV